MTKLFSVAKLALAVHAIWTHDKCPIWSYEFI